MKDKDGYPIVHFLTHVDTISFNEQVHYFLAAKPFALTRKDPTYEQTPQGAESG